MERSHYQAMAELAPVAQHQTLIDAFPDVSLRQLFVAAGCWSITEKGGTAQSELYTGQCTTLQVVRELVHRHPSQNAAAIALTERVHFHSV